MGVCTVGAGGFGLIRTRVSRVGVFFQDLSRKRPKEGSARLQHSVHACGMILVMWSVRRW